MGAIILKSDKGKNIVRVLLYHEIEGWGLVQISEWDDGTFTTIELGTPSSQETLVRDLDPGWWRHLSVILKTF